jgi:hypothetical protein
MRLGRASDAQTIRTVAHSASRWSHRSRPPREAESDHSLDLAFALFGRWDAHRATDGAHERIFLGSSPRPEAVGHRFSTVCAPYSPPGMHIVLNQSRPRGLRTRVS